jgi:hypothetical protein
MECIRFLNRFYGISPWKDIDAHMVPTSRMKNIINPLQNKTKLNSRIVKRIHVGLFSQ